MAKKITLHVRMSEDEKRIVDDLAADYRMKTSEFIRNAMSFLRTVRPSLVIEENNVRTVIEPQGKA